MHVDFEVTFVGSPATRVAVDGALHVNATLIAVPEPTESKTIVQLGLFVGPPYPSSAAAAMRFDNVVYRATVR